MTRAWILAILVVVGGSAFARQSVVYNKESLFFAGKYKIYAQKADFSIKKHGKHVVDLDLRLWLYRGELYHLVKAGVTNVLDENRLIQYRPLVPIIVDLRAKPVVVKALDKAMRTKKGNSVLGRAGPWKDLTNFRFIRSKQDIRPDDIKPKK